MKDLKIKWLLGWCLDGRVKPGVVDSGRMAEKEKFI